MYSPVLAGGSAYIGQEYLYMHALDIESGKRLWRFTSPDGIGTSAVVEDGVLYFTGAEHLYALESAPAAEKAGKRLPALNPVDAARIRSMLGHESLLEMKPEERAHLAAAALSEIEGRRLPEPMIRMLESIANSPPAERAYVVYEQVEKLVEEWETTCPYGMRILQAISCADPEKKIEILYEGCKLERFELLEVERCKKSPLGACLFVVFLIHDYLERHDALQPIETRLFRLMLTGQDPEKDGE